MTPQRVLGSVLVVIGIILMIVGLNATDSVSDRFSNFFTGSFTDSTMWYLIGGAVIGLAGVALLLVRPQKRTH